ncbi:hypothetical protein AGMMS49573_10760 [Endomicrobiia bacterium]|nr:hypothetical protein AGMMS49573_10760 [Endomicrobiia bacterium]
MAKIDVLTGVWAMKKAESIASIGGVLSNIALLPDGSLVFTYTPKTGNPIDFNAGIVPTGRSISTATIDVDGCLVLVFDDDTTINVGNVVGAKGDKGDPGENLFEFDGETYKWNLHVDENGDLVFYYEEEVI